MDAARGKVLTARGGVAGLACGGVAKGLRERSLFLIARQDAEDADVLVLRLPDGQTALPIFGLEEEAGMFLWLETAAEGWHVVEISEAKLVALLRGSCAGVRRIVRPFAAGGTGKRPATLDCEEFLRELGQASSPARPHGGTCSRAVRSSKSTEGWRA